MDPYGVTNYEWGSVTFDSQLRARQISGSSLDVQDKHFTATSSADQVTSVLGNPWRAHQSYFGDKVRATEVHYHVGGVGVMLSFFNGNLYVHLLDEGALAGSPR